MQVLGTFRKKLVVAISMALFLPLAGVAGGGTSKPSRAEKVVMQLRMGSGSAGFHILEAERNAREMQKGIRKALYKVRAADKVYAKSVNKPDSRYFESVAVRLATLKEKSEAMENEIHEAFSELKESINQTLIMGEVNK